jgi:hypothetical protein
MYVYVGEVIFLYTEYPLIWFCILTHVTLSRFREPCFSYVYWEMYATLCPVHVKVYFLTSEVVKSDACLSYHSSRIQTPSSRYLAFLYFHS